MSDYHRNVSEWIEPDGASDGTIAFAFEAILPTSNPPLSDASTTDTGTAIPLPPPQDPIFLLTGQ